MSSLNDVSILEESFIVNLSQSDSLKSDTSEGYQDNKKKLLPWSFNNAIENFAMNFAIEEQIIFCVIENIKIRNFDVIKYKVRMLNVMKKTHTKFIADMKDYI